MSILSKQVEALEAENARLKSLHWGNVWLQRPDGFGKPFFIELRALAGMYSWDAPTSLADLTSRVPYVDLAEQVDVELLKQDLGSRNGWERVRYRNTGRLDEAKRLIFERV